MTAEGKKFHYLDKKQSEALEAVRAWYRENNVIGLLKFVSEESGVLRPNVSRIFSGRQGCNPATLAKFESAMKKWKKKKK